jgi:uncharacterized protein with WD repeat
VSHEDKINSLSFSPQGKFLTSASEDSNIIVWDLDNEKMKVFTRHLGAVNNVIFSPNGKILASAGVDKKIKLWNWKSQSDSLIHTFTDFRNSLYDISFHPNGQILASADEASNVRLWGLDNYQQIELPNKIKGYSATFTPDGKTIITTIDEKIILWNVDDGKKIGELIGHEKGISVYKVNVSPNGKLLASASGDKSVKIWDIKKQKLITTFLGHKDEVRDVTFSHDGKLLASAAADKTVKVWDVQKQSEITTFKRHSAPILSVSFSDDDKYLASAGQDKKIIVWDLDLLNRGKLLKSACESANSYLRASEGEDNNLCDGKMD